MLKKLSLYLVSLSLLLSVFAGLYSPAPVSAANGADWQAGNIIADDIFTDKTNMSIADIQSFLNQKVGTGGYASIPGQCDPNGLLSAQPFSSQTRTQYGAGRSPSNPKFTCLKDYYEVPKTSPGPGIPASNYGGVPIPPGAKSAAHLIYDAAQTYNINPKVLLVKIQTESAGPLTTDDWPFKTQYTYAMGAHCPDSGPGGAANCDSNYAGFSIQISEAASLLRYYLDNMGQPWWPYKKLGNNTILYQNSKPECGSSTVNIITKATAALYTYTPYQPNQAALNNMYTTGDACSAYGNRNFWRTYTDWFGLPNAPAFRASYQSQSSYPIIDSGLGVSVFFQFRNSGTAFWKDDMSNFPGYRPVHLATTTPINRGSAFRANNWLSPSRPTGTFSKVFLADGVTLAPEQHTVQPGQVARFEFTIHVDPGIPPGVYREYFQPILEGGPDYTWNMQGGAYLDIGVNRPAHKAAWFNQSAYPTIIKGSSAPVHIAFKNVGSTPWFDDVLTPKGKRPIHLATSWPINRGSKFASTWPSASRAGLTFTKVFEADGVTLASAQHTVQPGQIARFEYVFSVPANTPSGVYKEYFEPVIEGAPNYGWGMGASAWLGVTVP